MTKYTDSQPIHCAHPRADLLPVLHIWKNLSPQQADGGANVEGYDDPPLDLAEDLQAALIMFQSAHIGNVGSNDQWLMRSSLG